MLSRHEVPSGELKPQTPFVLAEGLGLVDANIISEMLRNIPGTEVSLAEHITDDGNLVLLDLILESALNTNYLVELVGGDAGLKVVQKLQSRQQLSHQVVKQRIANLTAANLAFEQKERAPVVVKSADNGFSKEAKQQMEQFLEEKDRLLLEQEKQLLKLTDKVSDLTTMLEDLSGDKKRLQELYQKTKTALEESDQKHEAKVASLLRQMQEKDETLESTVEALNETSARLNEIRDDIEQAEEAIRVYRERIA